MIERFIEELNSEIEKNKIEDSTLLDAYKDTYEEYIHLGQSEFDIIRHFGEPKDIVSEYLRTGKVSLPNMDERLEWRMPAFLEAKEEKIVPEEEEESNPLPTTKAGIICNDIFFVGLGLLIALAGVVALGGVSIFMTAGSIAQMSAVWELATHGEQVGGFMLALMMLIISVLFYVVIVWIVMIVIKFMKKYTKHHKESWAKALQNEQAQMQDK